MLIGGSLPRAYYHGDGLLSTDPSKIQAIADWPQATCVKDFHGFLALACYYRKLVWHFVTISKPLTKLLKKNIPFLCIDAQTDAFQLLKEAECACARETG